MSRSSTLAFAALVAAAVVTACSDATGPRPSFSCETQGSNSGTPCPPK